MRKYRWGGFLLPSLYIRWHHYHRMQFNFQPRTNKFRQTNKSKLVSDTQTKLNNFTQNKQNVNNWRYIHTVKLTWVSLNSNYLDWYVIMLSISALLVLKISFYSLVRQCRWQRASSVTLLTVTGPSSRRLGPLLERKCELNIYMSTWNLQK